MAAQGDGFVSTAEARFSSSSRTPEQGITTRRQGTAFGRIPARISRKSPGSDGEVLLAAPLRIWTCEVFRLAYVPATGRKDVAG